ncbi:hypothetical protein F1559_003525 [Cyanidiococcus yangmingshanensis]|uniref:Uncharacterized protein n=1 Tax=Cyanidiococcus yangmingshanensis TaxID=2690220 RepID=A0A7J7IFB3_9RHOD|nr:hypothetical protein F1559_003525 [Cyanidiococcus yangmingshanensis]
MQASDAPAGRACRKRNPVRHVGVLRLCCLGLFFLLIRSVMETLYLSDTALNQYRIALFSCAQILVRFPELHALLQLIYSVADTRTRITALVTECLNVTTTLGKNTRLCQEQAVGPHDGLQVLCEEVWPLVSHWQQALENEWLLVQRLAFGETGRSSVGTTRARTTGLEMRVVDHCHTASGVMSRSLDELTRTVACTDSHPMDMEQTPLLHYSQVVFGLSCCHAIDSSNDSRLLLMKRIRRYSPQAAVVCCFADVSA